MYRTQKHIEVPIISIPRKNKEVGTTHNYPSGGTGRGRIDSIEKKKKTIYTIHKPYNHIIHSCYPEFHICIKYNVMRKRRSEIG